MESFFIPLLDRDRHPSPGRGVLVVVQLRNGSTMVGLSHEIEWDIVVAWQALGFIPKDHKEQVVQAILGPAKQVVRDLMWAANQVDTSTLGRATRHGIDGAILKGEEFLNRNP